jgi:hypothetical protein
MRVPNRLFAILVVACVYPTHSHAQAAEPHRADEAAEPYHKHHDTRHGHDHFYPDRGSIVRDLPRGTIGVTYAGMSYRYHDGIWLEPRGPAFVVVAPPIGLVVPTLPKFSTILAKGGETYLYVNDTYYRPRPELSGYEVVNEPIDESSPAESDSLVGGQLPTAAAATAATQVAASTSAAPSTVVAAGVPASVSGSASVLPVAKAISPQMTVAAPGVSPAAAGSNSTPAVVSTPAASEPPATVAAAASVPVMAAAGAASNSSSSGTPPKGPKVFLYPKNGQTSDQQARDRYDCYRFAVAQSGFDPMHSPGAQSGEPQADYDRAQSACFEARGYASR